MRKLTLSLAMLFALMAGSMASTASAAVFVKAGPVRVAVGRSPARTVRAVRTTRVARTAVHVRRYRVHNAIQNALP